MARKADTVPPHELKQLFLNQLRKAKQSAGLDGYVALPVQVKFHTSRAKGKLMMGGNRVGKTVGGAVETAMRLCGIHEFKDEEGNVYKINHMPPPPVRGRGVAVDNDRGITLIMIPELKKWIPSRFLINNNWDDSYSKTNKILTLTNGSTMEFMSYEQDPGKFQGTSRHFIWFDEEPPDPIYKECMARLIDTDGDWWITMTPLIEMSWTYDALYYPASVGLLNSIELFEGQLEDNSHINMAAFDRLTQTMSTEEKETRKTGVYISHTGLVYGESFRRTQNVMPDIVNSTRWEKLRTEWQHFQMMDHGYNNPTAILFGCYDHDGRVIIYDEIYVNKTLIKDIAELWLTKRLELGIETEYSVGDPNIVSKDPIKGMSIQAAYAEHGIFIGLGNNDVQPGIARTQAMFREQNLFVSERCRNLLSELLKYRWDRHITKIRDRRNKKEEPLKKDDHAMDALRYGMMSNPRYYEEVDEPIAAMHNVARPVSDYDWELITKNEQFIDEILGSEV